MTTANNACQTVLRGNGLILFESLEEEGDSWGRGKGWKRISVNKSYSTTFCYASVRERESGREREGEEREVEQL